MKVYALVFDYLGYEEQVVGIFSTYEKAEKYITCLLYTSPSPRD